MFSIDDVFGWKHKSLEEIITKTARPKGVVKCNIHNNEDIFIAVVGFFPIPV